MVLCSQSLGNRRIRVDVADQAQDKGKKLIEIFLFCYGPRVTKQRCPFPEILIKVDSSRPT